ncbi:unnamed protein product [Aureobasidium pullulans]|nr:unnamed protein product [Aureobasidium pullulans]
MSTAVYKLKLERAEVIIGYYPRKPAEFYLWEALQVAGSGQNLIGGRRVYDGNKRLAIVGDAAMASAIAGPWYEQDDTLGSVAHETGLVGCMVVNPRNPVQASTKLAANLVEAVIGAVWLDSDESMSAVRQVMETLGLGLNGMVKLNPFSLL